MAGEGDVSHDVPRIHSLQSAADRAEMRSQVMRPADLIPHLQGRIDAAERVRKDQGEDDPRLLNVNLLGTATIPGKKGRSGIEIAKFSDSKDSGVRFEVTTLDDDGQVDSVIILDKVHSKAGSLDLATKEIRPVDDLTALYREILDLEEFNQDKMDFEARKRIDVQSPLPIKQHGGRFRLPERIKNIKNWSFKKQFTAGLAAGAVLAASAFGIGKAVDSDEAPAVPPSEPAAAGPAVPGPEIESPVGKSEKRMIADIDTFAKGSATQILTHLENPKSGAEPEDDGRGLGNKSTLLGPDTEPDTADDAKYPGNIPEIVARVDERTGKLFIKATSGVPDESDENKTIINSEEYVFEPGGDFDPDHAGVIGADVMKKILADPGTRLTGAYFLHDPQGGGESQYYAIVFQGGKMYVSDDVSASTLIRHAYLDTTPDMNPTFGFKQLVNEEDFDQAESDVLDIGLTVNQINSAAFQ